MRRILRYSLTAFLLALACGVCMAQTDRKEVRAGNRQYRKGNWQNAEIEYRKAQAKDSTSFAAGYNLAGALYREGNFDEAAKTLDRLKEIAPASGRAADYFYNQGNVAVQKKDWKAAVEAYKQSILLNPEDLEAKENYAYAKQMLKDEEQQGGGGDNQQDQDNKDQDNNQDNSGQNQNQNQNDNPDQNQGDRPDPQQDPQQGEGDAKISPQQAQQMLKAIQAREKKTQDKVNKEKAALLKSRQKEKNW
ncbi:tetratricopeptide repeat [Alistipes sp. CAG:514]|nr:tetratricopeptide repeat [Alistipes sp. CAG:514]